MSQFNLFEDIPADSASEELLTQNGNLDLVSLEIFIHISRYTRYVTHLFQIDKDFYERHSHPTVEATTKTPRELEKISFNYSERP